MLNPKYIAVHTAAFGGRNCDRDVIDKWHLEREWSGIGYHYVIINDKHDTLADGTVQEGRNINRSGAHIKGLNSQSIGICCVGHGDKAPFTKKQTESLISLISELIDQYEDITVDRIIGHREVNRLVAEGIIDSKYKTSKSCPGKLIDMDELRASVRNHRVVGLGQSTDAATTVSDAEIMQAVQTLGKVNSDKFPNAHDELQVFLNHPEVLELLDE